MLAFTTACFLFVSAGLIHACDVILDGGIHTRLATPTAIDLSLSGQYAGIEDGEKIAFHQAIYLLVVTITTVCPHHCHGRVVDTVSAGWLW